MELYLDVSIAIGLGTPMDADLGGYKMQCMGPIKSVTRV